MVCHVGDEVCPVATMLTDVTDNFFVNRLFVSRQGVWRVEFIAAERTLVRPDMAMHVVMARDADAIGHDSRPWTKVTPV